MICWLTRERSGDIPAARFSSSHCLTICFGVIFIVIMLSAAIMFGDLRNGVYCTCAIGISSRARLAASHSTAPSGSRGTSGLAVPAWLAQHSAFVGRAGERAQLERAFEMASAGQGIIVMLGGEPGIGKTTICEHLRQFVLEHAGEVLVGQGERQGAFAV